MIKDLLTNTENYCDLSDNIKKGLKWLKETDLLNLNNGKYNILENVIFANVQTYKTKDDAKYESHRKYIDIQYIIKGSELIGITTIDKVTPYISYDEDCDIEFFNALEPDSYHKLSEGEFMILYPDDLHKPSISDKQNELVKKVVIKVAV